ncbi:MAG: NAD-dependent epimerase/dehydratase family protein [Fimbriimonas sp.]
MSGLSDFKRVLIFGGAGFIGRFMVEAFLRDTNAEVVVADILTPVNFPKERVTSVIVDIREPLKADFVEGEFDLVVNLAAIAKEPGYPNEHYYDVNAKGALNILNFMRERGLKRLWFTSSMSTYGPYEEPCSETSAQNPNTAYGGSKLLAEAHHHEWLKEDEERVLIMCRPAVIFGPGENGNFTRLARALKKRRFVYPGRKDTIKANGYVGDLVASFFFMNGKTDRQVTYNFCYPQTYTIQRIVEAFCSVWSLPKPPGSIPKPVVLFLAQLLKIANKTGLKGDIHPDRVMKVLRSTNIVPTVLLASGFEWPTKNLEGGLGEWIRRVPGGEFGES